MKFKNKILASVLALILSVGVLGLPAFKLSSSKAYNGTIASNQLEILNVDKNYDIVTNNVLTFRDYCENDNARFVIYNPDGTELGSYVRFGGYGTQPNFSSVTFRNPGLYALQFFLPDANGFNIYSDVIYIPVSSGTLETINLDGTLNSRVKPKTVVTVPMPINADWTEDTRVSIKVYTPYGEVVEATKSSLTNKWSFTNKDGVLGTYFVEYTKQVVVGGKGQTIYKYEKIEFSSESNSTNSTKNFERDENAIGELKLVVSNSDIASEKDYLYLYKYYNLKNVFVQNEDGSTNPSDVYVAVYDKTDQKYYNFTNGKFDLTAIDEAKKNVKSAEVPENFVLKNTSEKKVSINGTGHEISVIYMSSVDGTELKEEINRTEIFKLDDIAVSLTGLVDSEITDVIISDDTTAISASELNLYGVKVSANGNYDLEAIKEYVNKVELTVSPSANGESQTSSMGQDANNLGIETIGDENNPLGLTFVYHYNRNIKAERFLEVEYRVWFGNNELTSSSISKPITIIIYQRTETKDKTAPTGITIGAYDIVNKTGNVVIPNATASDKDDLGNVSTGAEVKAYLTGGAYNNQIVTMGATFNLTDGDYTIRYVATDACENQRVRVISFKVDKEVGTVSPTLTIATNSVEKEENKYTVSLDTDASSVLIYGAEDGPFVPSKVVYNNNKIKSFEFEAEISGGLVAVLKNSNDYSTVYSAILLNAGSIENSVRSLGFGGSSQCFKNIIPNTTIEANVLDKLVWFGGSQMEIEAPENAYYTITDKNIISFYTAGTYVIKSKEKVEVNGYVSWLDATTTLTIKNTFKEISTYEPYGNKLVAQQGEILTLNFPVITNLYGYDFELVIKDSLGNIVTDKVKSEFGSDIRFTAINKDEYTLEFIYRTKEYGKHVKAVNITTGNIAKPKVSLLSENKNATYSGNTIKYVLADAQAVDKNGKLIDVNVVCFDQYGKALTIKTEGTSKYVELSTAGFYTIYYSAIDEAGRETTVTSSFAIEFPEEEEEGLGAWAVIGIIFGSVTGACAIALLIMFAIKFDKKKKRFINKSRANKKKEKQEKEENTSVYTIAESKDEKHWLVKKGSKTIAKVLSKSEAIETAQKTHKKGEIVIKVYNKNGRLIDSI